MLREREFWYTVGKKIQSDMEDEILQHGEGSCEKILADKSGIKIREHSSISK
jgi:hypothetical protein